MRVEGLCASYCALYVAPAARVLTVPPGSMVAFTTVPQPAELGIVEALLGHPDTLLNQRPRLLRLRELLTPLLEAQKRYFDELGVNSEKAVAAGRLINVIAGRIRGQASRLMLVVDANYLKECLGVANVVGAAPSPGETRAVTGSARPLVAFVINGRVYHKAADQRIAPDRYSCGLRRS
jgi:hypothetical protein